MNLGKQKTQSWKTNYKEACVFMSVISNFLFMKKLSTLPLQNFLWVSCNSDTVMDSESQLRSLLTYKVSKIFREEG